jgi:hypothetical protein
MTLKRALIPAKKWPLKINKWIGISDFEYGNNYLILVREYEVLSVGLGSSERNQK